MTYATFDDNFADHPKVAGLSDPAFRLHVAGICYAARHLTDGVLPADEVPRLVRRFKRTAVTELVKAGMWCDANGDGTYRIHDYLDWNLSRAQVLERRERARKNARKRWDG